MVELIKTDNSTLFFFFLFVSGLSTRSGFLYNKVVITIYNTTYLLTQSVTYLKNISLNEHPHGVETKLIEIYALSFVL